MSRRQIVAYAPDLMDQTRLRAAGAAIVRTVDELAGVDADLVLVDLGRPGVLDAVGRIQGRVIGFGPHVDRELLAAAEAAGCDEVLARSVFFRRLPDLVAETG